MIVVECGNDKSHNVHFPPVVKNVRGRFNAQMIAARNPDASRLLRQFPDPVPGGRIYLDEKTGEGSILEPLRLDEFKDLRSLFEKRGIKVPEDQHFQNVSVTDWLYCLKDLVDAGLATVLEGKIPSKIEGKRSKSFIVADAPDEMETLRATVAENSRVMRECVEAIKALAEAISNDWNQE